MRSEYPRELGKLGFAYDACINPSLPKSSSHTFWGGVWNPKRPSQEVFGGPNIYSAGIWKTRESKQKYTLLNGGFDGDLPSYKENKNPKTNPCSELLNDLGLNMGSKTRTHRVFLNQKHDTTSLPSPSTPTPICLVPALAAKRQGSKGW